MLQWLAVFLICGFLGLLFASGEGMIDPSVFNQYGWVLVLLPLAVAILAKFNGNGGRVRR